MDYWNSFWKSQGAASHGQHPQAQVLRTLRRQPVSAESFDAIMTSITALLLPDSSHALLDLCCGSGAVTRRLFDRFQTIVAMDIAPEFVAQINCDAPAHVSACEGDAKTIEFLPASYDRILLYAGLQYFSEEETVALFTRLRRWIRPGGRIVLGDIPDRTKRWVFFDTVEREDAYFVGLGEGQPLVGFWFESEWLIKLARHAGFSNAK